MSAQPNKLVTFINELLANLFQFGRDTAQKSAVAAQPWLGWPIISSIFGEVLDQLHIAFNRIVVERVDQIIIKAQHEWKRKGYDEALEKFKQTEASLTATIAEKDAEFKALSERFYKLVEQSQAATIVKPK
jgi:hypothetical protein